MSIYHDEIEIEDMEYDDETELYYYPCPCGDKFQISKVNKQWCSRGQNIEAEASTLKAKLDQR